MIFKHLMPLWHINANEFAFYVTLEGKFGKLKHDETFSFKLFLLGSMSLHCICYLNKDITLTPDTGNFHTGVSDW